MLSLIAVLLSPAGLPGQSLHERILADEAKDQANEIIRKERALRNQDSGSPNSGERDSSSRSSGPSHPHTRIKDGFRVPEEGYEYVSSASDNFEVQPIPGTAHAKWPHVRWGPNWTVLPMDGYNWLHPDRVKKKDFRVQPMPDGSPHEKYPNVVWAGDGRQFRPAPGYSWLSDDPGGNQDYRVQPLPDGTPHEKYPNVVWVGDGRQFQPAPGYQWLSDNPGGNQDYRVQSQEERSKAADLEREKQERLGHQKADPINNEAVRLLKSGKPDEALAKLDKALELLPGDKKITANWWIAKANISLREAKLDDVIAALESAVSWDPENREAKTLLVRAQAQRSEQGSSIQAEFLKAQKRLMAGPATTGDLPVPAGAFGTNDAHPTLTPIGPATPGTITKPGDQLKSAAASAATGGDLTNNFDIGGAKYAGSLEVIRPNGFSERARNDPRMIGSLQELSTLQEQRSALQVERDALVKERNLAADAGAMEQATQKLALMEAEYQQSVQAVSTKAEEIEKLHRTIDSETEPPADSSATPPAAALEFLTK